MSEDDTRVARPTALYPPADITPSEFEEFVAEQLLASAGTEVSDLRVTLHDKVRADDGTYDFDATVRYQFAGMSFFVVVEAKKHKDPIKRELVQVLYQKILSTGAHKGLMVSTAPYQSGALTFAKKHGIALVTVTEGRFLYETRDALPTPQLSREEAAARFGFPTFVGSYYGPGDTPGSTRVFRLIPGDDRYPGYIAEFLLGRPQPEPTEN
jgi:hypothetical protein